MTYYTLQFVFIKKSTNTLPGLTQISATVLDEKSELNSFDKKKKNLFFNQNTLEILIDSSMILKKPKKLY